MPGAGRTKQDGSRLGIGGPYRNRIGLTLHEYKVLLEMFNHLADIGVQKKSRTVGHNRYELEVKPFIKKLLKMGLKCGYTTRPDCFREVH